MATDGASMDATFPEAEVQKELNPGQNKKFEVDSVSSDIATAKEIHREQKEAAKKKEMERQDAMQTLKRTILVSVVVVAVAGAVFAVTKKLREK